MDNVPTTQTPRTSVTGATETLKVVMEGKNQRLLKLVPDGESPRLYIDLLKEQVMRHEGTDAHLLYFMYVCKKVGLDPLAKQIYAVFRRDSRTNTMVMTIQAGIDGFRLVAQRTKEYAGQDDIRYLPEDENTIYPTKATCTVYRMIGTTKVAFTASARWSEYCVKNYQGEPQNLWKKMPYLMLGKCAEALALRKAFPNELSGIYTTEEMAQATPEGGATSPPVKQMPQPATQMPTQVIPVAPKPVTQTVTQQPMAYSQPAQSVEIGSPAPKEVSPAVVMPRVENPTAMVNELHKKATEAVGAPISYPPEEPKDIWHYANVVMGKETPICGNQFDLYTTKVRENVNCPACLKIINILPVK